VDGVAVPRLKGRLGTLVNRSDKGLHDDGFLLWRPPLYRCSSISWEFRRFLIYDAAQVERFENLEV